MFTQKNKKDISLSIHFYTGVEANECNADSFHKAFLSQFLRSSDSVLTPVSQAFKI